jgi:hypothetical protein
LTARGSGESPSNQRFLILYCEDCLQPSDLRVGAGQELVVIVRASSPYLSFHLFFMWNQKISRVFKWASILGGLLNFSSKLSFQGGL